MTIIYTPRGKAREYSPLAANLYTGCDHQCIYCYVQGIPFIEHSEQMKPKKQIIDRLKKQIKKNKLKKLQVLLSFTHDPYGHAEEKYRLTRKALIELFAAGYPVSILSKGGRRILMDLDLFQKYSHLVKIGATLTFITNEKSLYYEPCAALPAERFEVLKNIHKQNIKTWASLEPVIDPDQTIEIIKTTHQYVDEYQIGKINYRYQPKDVDWSDFMVRVVSVLRKYEKSFYIKKVMWPYCENVELLSQEKDMDRLTLKTV